MRLPSRRRRERADVPPTPAADPPPTAADIETQARIAAFVDPLVARSEPAHQEHPGPVSEALHSRISAADLAITESLLDGGALELWEQTPPEHRHALVLIFAAYYDVPGVLASTGLVRAVPPEDVHAMARGVLAAAGDPMLADTVALAFEEAGVPLSPTGTILDFGCSSGRVLRVLAAYAPDARCIGCDPNDDAVAWADEHLPMAEFFVSPTAPPLTLEPASVDHAYAISIWSHFDAAAAVQWLEEMHRVIKPGGALLLTSHGLDTLGQQLRMDLMTHDSAAEAMAAMLQSGHKFFDVFGEDGDWGVKDAGWGNSYTSVDWLLTHATPAWSLRLFRPAMLARNQDVFVLERRP